MTVAQEEILKLITLTDEQQAQIDKLNKTSVKQHERITLLENAINLIGNSLGGFHG